MKTVFYCLKCGKKSLHQRGSYKSLVCIECCAWVSIAAVGKVTAPGGLKEIRKLREEVMVDED